MKILGLYYRNETNTILEIIRDIYTEQSSPFNLEFGHLMETPNGWEERYERKDFKRHRHQGKVNQKSFAENFTHF